MSAGWQYVIHQSALETIESLSTVERSQVRRCIEKLLTDPHQQPDAERRSLRERAIRVRYVGLFCVLYWLDSFVRELRIVGIERVKPK